MIFLLILKMLEIICLFLKKINVKKTKVPYFITDKLYISKDIE